MTQRSFPPGAVVALLAGVLVTYGAVMAFLFAAVTALGGSEAWGAAVATPLAGTQCLCLPAPRYQPELFEASACPPAPGY